jgi:hypothetical protein
MMLRSRNLSTGEALPLMPADQLRGSLRFAPRDRGPFTAPQLRLAVRQVHAKRIAGATEPFAEFDNNPAGFGISSTPMYRLVEVGVSSRLTAGSHPLDVSVDVQNLLDTPYRDFLDTQKGFALAQGRNVAVRISAPIRFIH